MENFVFHNETKLIFGKGTIEKIGEEIKVAGLKKVLMLCGSGSIKKNGVYDLATESLKKGQISWVEVWGIKPNPVLSKVHEAVEIARKEKVEAILGIGGGSVIDSAKAVAAGVVYAGDIWDAFVGKYKVEKALPVFAILTISATGTEMNGNAVITNEKTQEKLAVSSKALYPKVSIIDPSVQASLPKEQTVYGAVDAIAHILEYYFDGSDALAQDELSEALIRTIMVCTEKLLNDPNDYEARANFAWSATLALNGLTAAGRRGGDWACHRIEHSLSAIYDIAHGAGLAIVFPAWMKHVWRQKPQQFIRFAKKVFSITSDGETAALDGIEAFKSWLRRMGAPVSLRDVNIPSSDLDKIVENVFRSGRTLGQLKKLDRSDVKKILELAF
ncbi:iron-containing alcohol dehydrogenase [Pseudothermotoga sp.]|nr:iron-containing alcohol dehydrogenase [Pseudothermotoga sp.]MCX7812448.1 iron-containing alcohol dehydrogenase [Pseudothermotoga sp.]MDW8140098.1 iron-containing alcohol dehydrogenase [Pseudothermotoga sp.]